MEQQIHIMINVVDRDCKVRFNLFSAKIPFTGMMIALVNGICGEMHRAAEKVLEPGDAITWDYHIEPRREEPL